VVLGREPRCGGDSRNRPSKSPRSLDRFVVSLLMHFSRKELCIMPAHPSEHTPNDYQKYIEAIRAGGFVCLFPQLIDPSWHSPARLLAGFPLNVCYTGLSEQSTNCQCPALVVASYWFDPATYREDKEVRAMSYRANPPSAYHVELIYWKKKQQWDGSKYRDDELLLTANASELHRFIIQLTVCGLSPGEPTQAMTCQHTASAGEFVFIPEWPSAMIPELSQISH